MKHTPGNWEAVNDTDIKVKSEYTDVKGEIKNGFIHIANVNHLMKDDEKKANAKLIAAAPDLLEALKTAQKLILQMGVYIRQLDINDECIEYWNQDGDYIAVNEWQTIENAIKKTTN